MPQPVSHGIPVEKYASPGQDVDHPTSPHDDLSTGA
jgi:hypothetical protein